MSEFGSYIATVAIEGAPLLGTNVNATQTRYALVVWNSGSAQTYIQGDIRAGALDSKLGFFGRTPVLRSPAYTMTFSGTVSRTVPNLRTGTATTTGVGFATATEFNNFMTDITNVVRSYKQLMADLGQGGSTGVGLIQ